MGAVGPMACAYAIYPWLEQCFCQMKFLRSVWWFLLQLSWWGGAHIPFKLIYGIQSGFRIASWRYAGIMFSSLSSELGPTLPSISIQEPQQSDLESNLQDRASKAGIISHIGGQWHRNITFHAARLQEEIWASIGMEAPHSLSVKCF